MDRLSNWDICVRDNWFGSPSPASGGVRAGDDVFLWMASKGLTARCRATADAAEVVPGSHVPWPDPGRYKYVWPIEIVAEVDSPTVTTQAAIDELAGRKVMLNQWVRLDDNATRRMADVFSGAGHTRIDVAVLPPIDLVYLQADHRTLIERAIAYRRGQNRFRSVLLEKYRGRCLVTETEVPDVLEAAHIHPYRGEHTDRIDNGLLLRSDIHTLFDLYKVTVLPTGMVRVHPSLHGTDYDFDHRKVQFPVSDASRPNTELLRWHNGQCAWLTRV